MRDDDAVLASFRALLTRIDALDQIIEAPVGRDQLAAIQAGWRALRLDLGFAAGVAYGAGCVLVSRRAPADDAAPAPS